MGGLRVSQWLILAALALVAIGARRRIFAMLADLPGALRRAAVAVRSIHAAAGGERLSWIQLLVLLAIAAAAFVASHPDGPRSW